MKIVFMGTPDFAVYSLNQLYQSEQITISAVVSQPDSRRGRGQKLKPTPVKKRAEELKLKVLQVEDVNSPEFIRILEGINPDVIVVVAFGQKLSKEILELPEGGCVNLHASLLPEYRGASPIHTAIINGEKVTGNTTMYMNEGWDTGDIIYKETVEINSAENVGSLHDKLAEKGASLLVKTLLDIEKGTAPRVKQDDQKATYAFKMDKTIGNIDWNKDAVDIYNLVRGVNPWPGAYTFLENQLLKIWEISLVDSDKTSGRAGEILQAADDGILVQTGRGQVKLDKIQLAGRKRMSAADFLRGYRLEEGTILKKN